MFYYILLTIFTLLFAWLSHKKLVWSLAIIIFALPSYLVRFKIGFVPTTLLEIMILVVFVVWLVKTIRTQDFRVCRSQSAAAEESSMSPSCKNKLDSRFRGNDITSKVFDKHKSPGSKEKINFSKFKWLIAAWLIISGIAVLISPNKMAALGIWKAYFIEPILFFIVFINTIKNKKDLNLIFYALGISALVISLVAIYQKFTGWLVPFDYWFRGEGPRVTSIFEYPNALGLYLGPIVGIFMVKILWAEKFLSKKTFFYVLVAGVSVLAIIFARSEGALAGIILGFLVFGFFVKKLGWRTLWIVLILLFLFFTVSPLQNFILQKISSQEWSTQVRLSVWSESWEMLKHNWLAGAGLAGYQKALIPYHRAEYIEIFLYPHNIILNFWSELGLIGLLVFFGLIGMFLKEFFRKIKTIRIKDNQYLYSCLLALCIILVHGLVDAPYFKNDLAVLFWLIFGMISVI